MYSGNILGLNTNTVLFQSSTTATDLNFERRGEGSQTNTSEPFTNKVIKDLKEVPTMGAQADENPLQ